ncbi:MAG: flagellar biosynthetic protein FliO [Candidatus Thiodiazotropha sp.]
MMRVWPLTGLLVSGMALATEATQKPVGVKVSPMGAESLISTFGGLILVLAVIFTAAWLFKRYTQLPMGGKGLVRVLGGASVGSRERVVVVEVDETRLVLGVSPGQVRTLHTFETRSEPFRRQLDEAVNAEKTQLESAGTSS